MSVAPGDPSFLQRLQGVLASPQSRDLGLALLANSGYSQTPQTFGQIAGRSALMAQQMEAQRAQDDIKRRYMEAQIAALTRKPAATPFGDINPSQYTPESIAKFQQSGNYGDLVANTKTSDKLGNYQPGDYTPASWAKFISGGMKDPAVLERYVTPRQEYAPSFQNVTRTLPDGSTQTGTFDTRTGAYNWSGPIVPPGKKAQVDAAGGALGKEQGAAQFDLPRVEQNVTQAISDIKALQNDPGLQYITGLSSKLPVIPGTAQAAADARARQVEGQTFLQAYLTLKGGGAITEIEGQKATQAIGRLSRTQSTETYQKALDDLAGVLQMGLDRARKQAGTKAPAKDAPQAALDYLKSHPEAANDFKAKYGYLP